MKFEWDETKNQLNFQKHKIWFEIAKEIFFLPRLTRIDQRKNYGEIREISIGQLEETLIIVVAHTDREGVTRIISARPAKQKERWNYEQYLKKTLERNC